MPKSKNKLGAMLAAVAILLAIGVGIVEATGMIDITQYGTYVTTALVVLGLGLGLFNIKKGESVPFMVAALVIAGGAAALTVLPYVGEWIQIIFSRIATLVIPAAIVVAIAVAYRKLSK